VRQSERVARANWQPTRARVTDPDPTTARSRTTAKPPVVKNQLRRVDHITVQNVPVPPPDAESLPAPSPRSEHVLSPAPAIPSAPMHVHPDSVLSEPLDGQIHLAPMHEGVRVHGGEIACDAMPGEVCGCGDVLCDGGCDGGGCGSGACCDDCGSCGTGGCSTCGEYCSNNAWRPCVTLCLPQDGWATFEYLSWYQDGMALPPLVTSSTNPNVPRRQAGVLGDPSTVILVGGEDVLASEFDGGRLRFGIWLDRCHTWGLGAEFFGIGRETRSFIGTSSGDPILARPFFNTRTGLEDSELVAFPEVVSGTVTATASSELRGGGFHVRALTRCNEGCAKFLFCGCPEPFCSRTEALFGYRFLQLEESVTITEDLVSTDTTNPGSFDIMDSFDTRNQFNGFDMGWMYRRTRGFWTFDGTIRLALGNTRQTVTINGETTINDPTSTPAVQTFPGGLLAQTSNIGTYRQNQFAAVPEINANIGYQLTDRVRVFGGYTFLYWSNVVRPGDQISRDLNPGLLPPPEAPVLMGVQRPGFAFDTTDYWAQGISVGAEYRW
jgi:hypothetical protein